MKYFALLAIAAFICLNVLLSVQPNWFEFIYLIPGRDKSVHFLVSGVLSYAIVAGFSQATFRGRTAGPLLCLAMTILLVTFEEFTQLAIPTRHFTFLDLGCSYAGVIVFGSAAIFILRRMQTFAK